MATSTNLSDCSLADFAAAVLDAARHMAPSGRLNPRKVWISSLWEALTDRREMTLEQFQSRLADAMAAEYLLLDRCDVETWLAGDARRAIEASSFVRRGTKFNVVIDPEFGRAASPGEASAVAAVA
jgi:hypothetical protein